MGITYDDIEVGDTVTVVSGWGRGEQVTGIVRGKEKDIDNEDSFIVDYYVDGRDNENWAYDYQLVKLIKEKV